MKLVKKILNHYRIWKARRNSDAYCDYLKDAGVLVGKGTHFDADSCLVDLTRPSLVSIGENCYMNRNFTLLTHDWVTHVFINNGREFLPSSGKVVIGNNVSFGQNVMVLKDVTIGDNCFIGAGSIVTKDIPSNSIAVGAPCKVIMSLDEYYNKRREKCVEEALEYARSIVERFNRRPIVTDFWEEFPLFINGGNIADYQEMIPIVKRQCGSTYDSFIKCHKSHFSGFEDFLRAAGID